MASRFDVARETGEATPAPRFGMGRIETMRRLLGVAQSVPKTSETAALATPPDAEIQAYRRAFRARHQPILPATLDPF